MAARLAALYRRGDWVAVTFGDGRWLPARVLGHDPPGMWVRTGDGQAWFVTNTRRVRPLLMDEEEDADDA